MSAALRSGALLWLALCTASALALERSPAEQKIEIARRAVAANPKNAEAHNALALALARRGRETGDHDWYEQAGAAVQEALRLVPDHFEARKIETWVLLGRHKFARALEQARALNRRVPDDVFVYALLADACVEMGEYAEAERAAQWALDLRPGDVAALTRAAYLRELFGDLQGAIDLLQTAYTRTPPAEVEDRAWMLCQFAHLELLRGAPAVAERALADALRLFPGYHHALAQLVKAHTASGRDAEAVNAARELYQAAPHPENRFVLGRALARAGQAGEAREVFAAFEKEAVRHAMAAENANRELALYYADHAGNPAEALRFAVLERPRRPDLFTRHIHAWALHACGRHDEARTEMEQALAGGYRDPVFFYHAGLIAEQCGDVAAARRHLEATLSLAPQSEVAPLARGALARLAQRP